jgi:hypothetical protein
VFVCIGAAYICQSHWMTNNMYWKCLVITLLNTIQKRQKNLLQYSAVDVELCRVASWETRVSTVNGLDKHRLKLVSASSRRSLHARHDSATFRLEFFNSTRQAHTSQPFGVLTFLFLDYFIYLKYIFPCGSTAQFWALAASMKLSVSFQFLDLGQ